MRHKRWLPSILLVLALIATACSGGNEEAGQDGDSAQTTEGESAGGDAASESGKTVTVAVPGVPEAVHAEAYLGDPTRWLEGALTTGLTAWKPLAASECDSLLTPSADSMQPALAESWEFLDGGKTLRMTLREGIQSRFGNTLTSEDVRWTWEMRRATNYGPHNLWTTVVAGFSQDPDPVRVIDDRTFELPVERPGGYELVVLADWYTAPLDSTEAKKHATADDPWALEWLGENSATFGPWYISEENFDPGREAILLRNPNYNGEAWIPHGNVERVIWRAAPDASTRMQLVQAGEADHTMRHTIDQLQTLEADPDVNVIWCAGPSVVQMIFNDEGPTADFKVRQAIELALDREAINEAAYAGEGTPSEYPFPLALTGLPDGMEGYPERDVERAKELLAEAGYPDGLELELMWTPQRSATFDAVGIQLQDQLGEVGIDLELTSIPTMADWSVRWNEANFEALLDLAFPMFIDGYTAAVIYYATGSVLNYPEWSNPEFDAAMQALYTASSEAEREDAIRRINDEWMEWLPAIQLIDERMPIVFSDRIDPDSYRHFPHTNVFLEELVVDN